MRLLQALVHPARQVPGSLSSTTVLEIRTSCPATGLDDALLEFYILQKRSNPAINQTFPEANMRWRRMPGRHRFRVVPVIAPTKLICHSLDDWRARMAILMVLGVEEAQQLNRPKNA